MSSLQYPVNAPQEAFAPGTTSLFGSGPQLPAVGTNYKDGSGSLPNTFDQSLKGSRSRTVNVVQNFPWTLSKVKGRNDIPYIRLSEHRNNQGMLKRQAAFYTKQTAVAAGDFTGLTGTRNTLDVYKEIWPDNPTGWNYVFPFFTKTQFELQTAEWQQVDSLDKTVGGALGSTASGLRKLQAKGAAEIVEGFQKLTELGVGAGSAALAYSYPVVGVNDRPRIFSGHNTRSVTIEFPLYNTLNSEDYKNNRDFYYIFASQNLFAKKNFITGLPPVFYRVYVPGQYFSYASCVTNFTVTNLGNLHYFDEPNASGVAVPDAYQISITLTELLMPSLNQYSVLRPGTEAAKVVVSNRS